MQSLNGKIMSADIPVVTIKNGVVVDKNEKLAPLFFNRCDDVSAWLKGRAIDSHRANSRLLKKALRLQNKDEISTVLVVNAVTITDNFWFCEDGSDLTWDDVRFKENYFDSLALRGDPDSFNQKPSRTPELTNIGSYEKCWSLLDGSWWMYKSGNDNELFSELFICKLGSSLGFNMAYYELDGGYIRTKDFTETGRYNFESAESLVGDDEDYSKNFDVFYSISKDLAEDYLKLIYLDTVCMNMDRHTKNYGVLRDPETGDIVKLAPNYDNNIALISRGYPRFIERKNDTLIDLFIELLKSNKEAFRLFKNLNIPVITDELIRKCISETPFDVDGDKISEFILNGQKSIFDFLNNQS